MKVSELIAKLQKLPQDLDVKLGFCFDVNVTDVTHKTYVENDNTTGRLKKVADTFVLIHTDGDIRYD